jgi:hypothetical protein
VIAVPVARGAPGFRQKPMQNLGHFVGSHLGRPRDGFPPSNVVESLAKPHGFNGRQPPALGFFNCA